MQSKIFIEGKDSMSRAYIGWQDGELSLYGIKEGYKRAADDLVEIAIAEGMKNRIDVLDMYIFPIMHCYRHSIEVSLKCIYYRTYGKTTPNIHDIGRIWDDYIVKKVVKDLKLNINDSEINEVNELIEELQMGKKDSGGDVWKYLMDREENLYFSKWEYIDYRNLKETIGYLYNCLDAIYLMVDDYLSGSEN